MLAWGVISICSAGIFLVYGGGFWWIFGFLFLEQDEGEEKNGLDVRLVVIKKMTGRLQYKSGSRTEKKGTTTGGPLFKMVEARRVLQGFS